MNGARWRGWVVAFSILILGVAVGGAATAWTGIRMYRHALQGPAGGRGLADRAAARISADLTRRLELTPEQSARVQTVLKQSAANVRAIRLRAAAEALAEWRASTERIAAELPADKQAEFYRLMNRRQHRLGLPGARPGLLRPRVLQPQQPPESDPGDAAQP